MRTQVLIDVSGAGGNNTDSGLLAVHPNRNESGIYVCIQGETIVSTTNAVCVTLELWDKLGLSSPTTTQKVVYHRGNGFSV